MAHNTIVVDAPPETVFGVLSDGFAYPDWIVGSEQVLAVDPGFPAPGTRFHHRSGTGPVKVRDHTEVVDAHPPYRLDLVARARPLFGSARVALLVAPRGRRGSYVTMIERAADLEFPRFCGVLTACGASVAGRMDIDAENEACLSGAVPARGAGAGSSGALDPRCR